MTQKQKEDFEHWLTNNLQITSKSNVELIIKHVEHYFCPTPPQSIEEAAKEYIMDNGFDCPEDDKVGKWLEERIKKAFIAGASYPKEEKETLRDFFVAGTNHGIDISESMGRGEGVKTFGFEDFYSQYITGGGKG